MITEDSVLQARAALPMIHPMMEKNAGLVRKGLGYVARGIWEGTKAVAKGGKKVVTAPIKAADKAAIWASKHAPRSVGAGPLKVHPRRVASDVAAFRGAPPGKYKRFAKDALTNKAPLTTTALTGGAFVGLPLALGMGVGESAAMMVGAGGVKPQMQSTAKFVAGMRPKAGPNKFSVHRTREFLHQMSKQQSTRPELTKFAFDEAEVRRAMRIKRSLQKSASVSRLMRASDGSMSSWFAKGLAFGLAGTAIGVGTSVGAYGASRGIEKFRGMSKDRNYNKMLKADPSLKGEPEAKTFFNVVHRASPYIAGEPVIAAATVRSMIDSPALDERKMKQIMEVEEQRQKTMHPIFSMGKNSPQAPRGLPDMPEM